MCKGPVVKGHRDLPKPEGRQCDKEGKVGLLLGKWSLSVNPLLTPPPTSPRTPLFFLRSQIWKAFPEYLEAVRSSVKCPLMPTLWTLVSPQREL